MIRRGGPALWEESAVDERIDPRLAELLARHLGSMEASQWLTKRVDALQALANPCSEVRLELAPQVAPGQKEAQPVRFAVRFAPALVAGGPRDVLLWAIRGATRMCSAFRRKPTRTSSSPYSRARKPAMLLRAATNADSPAGD